MVQLDVKSPSEVVQSKSMMEVGSESVASTSPVQPPQGDESPPTTYSVEATQSDRGLSSELLGQPDSSSSTDVGNNRCREYRSLDQPVLR